MKRIRKTDRRTLYTIDVIKESFIKLVNDKGYAKVTVAQVCREAEVTRSTFYLHFDGLSHLLNAVLDDALLLTQETKDVDFTKENLSFKDLNENESLVPACQRIGNSKKYQKLLMDPDLSEYIIGRIALTEKERLVPVIMSKAGVSREDAETIFAYTLHGSFAINRAHHFVKDKKWSHDVQMLNRFIQAGYQALKEK
ncbi:AcrR family transcriptional regulator [Lactobacillus colini]|uniref:AcrR family transcriptional regulator n=1 Tax=Lactobacillus colini TaxID=1819254 RepID=A0ABS4MGF3_9LACO|nr:TetR/AcrR family transcriptional regulator [Lactobacillus colini]MBP2058776.1 AcrR family transcriptional regulator [Lactobacillus colini]